MVVVTLSHCIRHFYCPQSVEHRSIWLRDRQVSQSYEMQRRSRLRIAFSATWSLKHRRSKRATSAPSPMFSIKEMGSNSKIVCSIGIVGGGIAGVAAAIAVARAGHHATVFEQAVELKEVRINLSPISDLVNKPCLGRCRNRGSLQQYSHTETMGYP